MRDLDLEPARYVNLALASWILVSAYLWPHSGAQFMVTIFVGAIAAILAPFEVANTAPPTLWLSPRVRKINLAAGALLVVAAVGLPGTSRLTLVHNVIAGLALMAISFFGPPHGIVAPRPPAPDDAYEGIGGV